MASKTEKSTVQLIIDGQQSKVSLKEMGAAVSKLKQEYRGLAEDHPDFEETARQLKVASEAYHTASQKARELSDAGKNLKSNWKDVFKGFLGGSVVTQGLQTLANLAVTVKEKIYSMSDSLSDVGKATDKAKSEVRELNSELSNLKTRTFNEELRDMATVAGKNGIQKDLAGFVKSTDMVNVAFGDEFDNVTQLTEGLIDVRKIFKDIQTDNTADDILHIGNAMNYLADAGTATGKTMLDFSSRMGGTLIPMGATSGQILGLATTLEELSVTAERGSTAINTIFQKMSTDVEGFAKVAGMSTKDFAHLINTDIFGAFNKFVVGAKAGGAQATEFAKILKDTELSGSGASEVVMKLASNQDMLAKYVGAATQKLKESSAITDEFNKKNNNAAAIMDKVGKIADNALEKLAVVGMDLIEIWGRWVGLVDESAENLANLSAQQDKVSRFESELPKLIKRYDELKKQSKLSADEQKELRIIIDQITGAVPGAASGFDAYGKAIDFNKDKVTQFIQEQRELLKVMRDTQITDLDKNLSRKGVQAQKIQADLNRGYRDETRSGAGGSYTVREKFTDAQIRSMQKELEQLQSDIRGNRRESVTERRKNRGYGYDPIVGGSGSEDSAGGNSPSKKPVTGSSSGSDDGKKAKKKKEWTPEDRLKAEMAEEKYDQKRADQKASFAEAEEKYDKQRLTDQKSYIDAEKEYDILMAEREAKRALNSATNEIGISEAAGKITPEEANLSKLNAEDTYLAQLFLIRKNYGQDTADLEQSQAEASIARAAMITKAEKQNVEQQRELALTLQTAKVDALEQGVGALKSYFKETSLIYKALFLVEKAAAIANVIIKSQAEIAATGAYAATLGPIAGPAYGAAMIAATKIRTGISIGLIAAQSVQSFVPGREEGGFTDLNSLRKSKSPAGYVNQPTLFDLGPRSYIAGENYKTEYVIPGPMLQDPYFKAQAEQMERYRTTGKHPLSGSGSASGSSGSGNIEALLMMQIDETRLLRNALQSGAIAINFNTTQFDEHQKYINYIRSSTAA